VLDENNARVQIFSGMDNRGVRITSARGRSPWAITRADLHICPHGCKGIAWSHEAGVLAIANGDANNVMVFG
jgi:hypothetical protein